MVSKTLVLSATVAAVGVNAQVDAIVASIVGQISAGLVAGRKSGVAEDKAASEVAQIIDALNKNTDVGNIITSGVSLVLGGINSSGVLNLLAGAKASLAAFEGSDDYKTVLSLAGEYITDLDPQAALASVSANLAPVLGLVVPPIASLSAQDPTIASGVNEAIGVLEGLYSTLVNAGAVATTSAEATSSEAASSTEAASSSAEATSTVEASSTAAASSTAEVTTSAERSSAPVSTIVTSTKAAESTIAHPTAANSTIPQVNGQTVLQGGVFAAGIFAAGALLL